MNGPQTALTLEPAESTGPRALAPRFDFSPQTFDQAMWLAETLAASEMVPKQYRGKVGDCFIAMQWGAELGLKPLQAMQSIAVVNGKPSIYGDAGKAVLLAGGCIIEEDDIAIVRANGRARCRITRPGRPPVERTYSTEDAKQAGLLGKDGPWRTNTQRQMAWRAFWFAARDAAADLLRGIGGAEESADIPPEKFMGAADEVRPPAQAPKPSAEEVNAAFQKWLAGPAQKAIDKGASADDVIAHARGRGTVLTDDQIAAIRALRKTEGAAPDPAQGQQHTPAPAPARDDDGGPTFGDDSMAPQAGGAA